MALLTLSEGLSSGDINRSVPRKEAGSAAAVRVSKRPERPPFEYAQPRPNLHAGTLSPADRLGAVDPAIGSPSSRRLIRKRSEFRCV